MKKKSKKIVKKPAKKKTVKKTKVKPKAKIKAKAKVKSRPKPKPKKKPPHPRASRARRPSRSQNVKSHLDRKELQVHKGRLLEVRKDVLSQIKEISEDTLMKSPKELSGDISGYSLHMADVATDNYEREFNFRLVSGERELLFEIEAAIERIKNDEYGVCRTCVKPIGKTRLKVIPYARYCRRCQEELEKRERM